MRFSLKWLLAGMAYAALYAAATATGDWLYADVLWAATFVAVLYAATLVVITRGLQRAAAVGFALGSLMLVACLHFSTNSVPTARRVSAWFPAPAPLPPRLPSAPVAGQAPPTVAPPSAVLLPNAREASAARRNAANTLATMVGGALATMAYRQHGERE